MYKAAIASISMLLLAAPCVMAADYGDLIDGKFDPTSKQQRTEIAKSLQELLEELSGYLPTLRPQDTDWIEQEQAALNKLNDPEARNSRQVQLLVSPEFNHARLHGTLANALDALRCIADDKSSVSREMMCWSVASYLLTDTSNINDSIAVLLREGRLPKTVLESGALGPLADEHVGYAFSYDAYGRGIQEYLVIPLRIPVQAGHRFRAMPATDSGACRATIPGHAGHPSGGCRHRV